MPIESLPIQGYIGICYKSRGRAFDGADCLGLVYLFYRYELGIDIGAIDDDYTDAKSVDEVAGVVAKNRVLFEPVDYDDRAFGDVILFNLLGQPVHIGVIVDRDKMIHTLAGHNSCLERYTSPLWSRRREGVYRWVS